MALRSTAKRNAWRTRTSLKGFSLTHMISGWNDGAETILTSMLGSFFSWSTISTGAKYMISISPVFNAETWAAYSLM